MGVVTAVIGGLLGGPLSGCPLSIKGPAAGLIVIIANSVEAFGGGTTGWQITLGAIVVAGLLQVLFGVFKWGRFVDLFPLSAIHGMLAAIGLIIIAKQIPVLLNLAPEHSAGKGPVALLLAIPEMIGHFDPKAGLIGLVSLALAMAWGLIKHPLAKAIPGPLLVLLFAIPASLVMNLAAEAPGHTLVKVGSLTEQLGFNASFNLQGQWGTFVKFVVMICLVGSLESLLTVKAIDLLDPWRRKSDSNRDLVAVGSANSLCGLLGGLPMISEVARSSANIAQGGRTTFANIFHGAFSLLAALLAVPVLELIPNSALAALLITVGLKLAHPRELVHMKKVGVEQAAIFLTTIVVTLVEDLLVGIAAGMVLKFLIHLFRGMPLGSTFKADLQIEEKDGETIVHFGKAAVFTNLLAIKQALDELPSGRKIVLDLKETLLLDHSVLSSLETFRRDFSDAGGEVNFAHLESMTPISADPLASRRRLQAS
jgi:MFS superfamily sulfate permease-like transporter